MKVLCIVAILLNISAVFCSAEDDCTSSYDFGGRLILTPYIESGNISEARELSSVTVLGWTGYSGFFTVNKECGGNLFFWFIPARNNCTNAPLFLWINGGPGATSMEAMFQENGPYESKNSSGGLTLRDVPWTNDVNMLYVDQPIGTGFSHPKNGSCLAENVTVSTQQLYTMLAQFFQVFPEYMENRFYLTGQSFGGHYIPCLGAFIDEMNGRADAEVVMNLKGIMVGNPFVRMDCSNYADYVYELGFVSAEERDELVARHREIVTLISQELFVEATNKWIEMFNYIVYLTKLPSLYYVGPSFDESSYYPIWLGTAEARCKLHVGNETFVEVNNDVYNMFKPDMAKSFAGYVETLLAKNYSVWFYSGNQDVSCLTRSTDCALLGLDWAGADGYRAANRTAWFHDGVLAGHLQRHGALALLTVKDAGHSVPTYRPKQMYDIVKCIVHPCDEDEPFCRLNFTAP